MSSSAIQWMGDATHVSLGGAGSAKALDRPRWLHRRDCRAALRSYGDTEGAVDVDALNECVATPFGPLQVGL